MPQVTDMVLPFAAIEQQGFDQRSEQIRKSRLDNRKAMMEIANDMASRGVSMSVEDMAAQAQALLGPGDWLYSLSPSQDALRVMTQSQNAAADLKKEELSRSQFANDVKESAEMEDTVAQWFKGGDEIANVMQKGYKLFGQERFDKVAGQLTNIQGRAVMEAEKAGSDFASTRFQTVDDAEEYIKSSPWLTPHEKTGIQVAARNNQDKLENGILDGAAKIGEAGYYGSDSDLNSLRELIRKAAPRISREAEDRLLTQAQTVAKNASERKQVALQRDSAIRMQETLETNGPRVMAEIAQLDQGEEIRRSAAAKEFAAGAAAVQATQDKFASSIVAKGKKATPQELAMLSGMSSHVIRDLDGYIKAVESGDKQQIARHLAESPTKEEHAQRAAALGRITTGRYNSVSEVFDDVTRAGLGTSTKSIEAIGAEMARQQKVATSSKSAASTFSWSDMPGKIGSDVYRALLAGKGEKAPADESDKVRQSAANAVESMKKGFVEDVAANIRGIRDAIGRNRSVGATAEEVNQNEFGFANDRAEALIRGMGINPNSKAGQAMVGQIVSDIMSRAGYSQGFTRYDTPAEAFKKKYQSQMSSGYLWGNNAPQFPPGVIVQNPRAGQVAQPGSRPF